MTEQPELSHIAPRTFGIACRASPRRNLQGGRRTQIRHSAGPREVPFRPAGRTAEKAPCRWEAALTWKHHGDKEQRCPVERFRNGNLRVKPAPGRAGPA